MKTAISTLITFMYLLTLFSFNNPNADTCSLTIEVKNLRNSKGVVQFALYNKDGSIPDQDYKKYYKIQNGEIVNGSSVITFRNIPAGTYSINILHDENMNGKIDKGFILPIEGVGFSNFQSINLKNRPNFLKSSFELKGDMIVSVKIIYM